MVEEWGREKFGMLSERIDNNEVLLIPLETTSRTFVDGD
jgi:hypothetical protein